MSTDPLQGGDGTGTVGWLEWSEATFEVAREGDRPILLAIGAVWCHWCHVMDRESYEDPETAALINELFVPVRVDRDVRPDIDARYQQAVQALSGQGGWPLTAFLTPAGEVFYGGTYFPPTDLHGRPSFSRVLREVSRVWRDERERVLGAATHLTSHLAELAVEGGSATEVSDSLVAGGIASFTRHFDRVNGGFGRAPKFPNPGALHLLLDHYLDTGSESSHEIVIRTLSAMASGGIYDHVGGGFHRYSVDPGWIVPHFEKMSHENGALLDIYARAATLLGEGVSRPIAEGIIGLYRDIAPELVAAGGYPASQDADLGPGDDGGYWTWTLPEIREALDDDPLLIRAATIRYGLGNPVSSLQSARDRHVLYLAADPPTVAAELGLEVGEVESILRRVQVMLRASREERPRPYVDERLYSGWVGLVSSAELAAARYLGLDDVAESALLALDRIWGEAFDPELGVTRQGGGEIWEGYLEDQAFVAQGYLDAYEWTQDPRYLERARRVAQVMITRFDEPESGALTDRPISDSAEIGLLASPYLPIIDSPEPSANGVAALVLLRLAEYLGEPQYRERAESILRAFSDRAREEAMAMATYLRAVDWLESPIATVVVVGEVDDDAARELLRTALRTYRPRLIVRWLDLETREEERASLPPELRGMIGEIGPRAYLCVGQSCAPPVSEPEELRQILTDFRG